MENKFEIRQGENGKWYAVEDTNENLEFVGSKNGYDTEEQARKAISMETGKRTGVASVRIDKQNPNVLIYKFNNGYEHGVDYRTPEAALEKAEALNAKLSNNEGNYNNSSKNGGERNMNENYSERKGCSKRGCGITMGAIALVAISVIGGFTLRGCSDRYELKIIDKKATSSTVSDDNMSSGIGGDLESGVSSNVSSAPATFQEVVKENAKTLEEAGKEFNISKNKAYKTTDQEKKDLYKLKKEVSKEQIEDFINTYHMSFLEDGFEFNDSKFNLRESDTILDFFVTNQVSEFVRGDKITEVDYSLFVPNNENVKAFSEDWNGLLKGEVEVEDFAARRIKWLEEIIDTATEREDEVLLIASVTNHGQKSICTKLGIKEMFAHDTWDKIGIAAGCKINNKLEGINERADIVGEISEFLDENKAVSKKLS